MDVGVLLVIAFLILDVVVVGMRERRVVVEVGVVGFSMCPLAEDHAVSMMVGDVIVLVLMHYRVMAVQLVAVAVGFSSFNHRALFSPRDVLSSSPLLGRARYAAVTGARGLPPGGRGLQERGRRSAEA